MCRFSQTNVIKILLGTVGIGLFAVSCAVVSFDVLEVTSDLPSGGGAFLGDVIAVSFSLPVEQNAAEDALSLIEGSSAVAVDTEWHSGVLNIKPSKGWKLGKSYRLDVTADIPDSGGRLFSPEYSSAFTYGLASELLHLNSWTPGENAVIAPADSITLNFNKPLSRTSFTEQFSVSPYRELDFEFTPDSASVTITAIEGWEALSMYKWTLSDAIASDGYAIDRSYSGGVVTANGLAQPEVFEVCPASPDGSGGYALSAGTLIDGTLDYAQPFAIVFSEPMEIDSVSEGLSITPAVAGFVRTLDGTNTTFVYLPDAGYKMGQRYRMVIQDSVKAASGVTLGADYELFFTADIPELVPLSITLDGSVYSPFPDEDTILSHQVVAGQIPIRIVFSGALDAQRQIDAVSKISVEAVFPVTAKIPRLNLINWSPAGTTVDMVWENFSADASIRNYYRITVKGGDGGITNGSGSYMEEDKCVVFYTQP